MDTKNNLDLMEKNLTDKEILQLINKIKSSNAIINKINLYQNKITHASAPALLNLKNLHEIDLTCNAIGSNGLIEIPDDSLLTNLSLKSTNIDAIGLIKLLKSKTLKDLNLYDNHISGAGLKYLDIPFNNTLESLSIGANPLGDQGVVLLMDKLPNLKRLSVADCQITDKGFSDLLNYSTLQALIVSGNPITDISLKNIHRNHSLKTLYLTETKITDKGAEYLFDNVNLESVFINFNKGISKQTQERLEKRIENIHINDSMDTKEDASYSHSLK